MNLLISCFFYEASYHNSITLIKHWPKKTFLISSHEKVERLGKFEFAFLVRVFVHEQEDKISTGFAII